MPDQLLDLLFGDGAQELVVRGAEGSGDQTGEMALIVAGVLERDGQGVHRGVRQVGVEARHAAGVDAAAQVRGHGHIGDQPVAHRLDQVVAQALGRVVLGQGAVRLPQRDCPIGFFAGGA